MEDGHDHTSGPRRGRIEASMAALTPARQAADDYRAQAPRRGRPIEKFERQGREAKLHRLTAQLELEQAQQRRQQARTDIRQGATVYHPDEVTTGAARTTESWQADRASCTNRPEDFFSWVLGRLKPLPRPAQKRTKPPQPAYLQGVPTGGVG